MYIQLPILCTDLKLCSKTITDMTDVNAINVVVDCIINNSYLKVVATFVYYVLWEHLGGLFLTVFRRFRRSGKILHTFCAVVWYAQ